MIAQTFGMAQYELYMMWRRGSLRLIAAAAIVLPLLMLPALAEQFTDAAAWTPPDFMAEAVTGTAIIMAMGLMPTLLVAIPALVSEVVPLDTQYGTRTMLDAMPVTHSTYLMGKVLGVWAGMTLTLIASGVVTGIAAWLTLGPYNLGEWLALWLVGIILYALLVAGLSVLAASGQPTRRRATLVGFALVPLTIYLYLNWPHSMFYHLTQRIPDAAMPEPGPEARLLIGAGLLALVWLLAWGWRRWRT